MNKILNLFLIMGCLLFLQLSSSSYGGLPFIDCFGPIQGHKIGIPSYDSTTIIIAVISIVLLSIVVIGKFKKLPNLTERNESYKFMLESDTFDG